jgi:hypothetical protein
MSSLQVTLLVLIVGLIGWIAGVLSVVLDSKSAGSKFIVNGVCVWITMLVLASVRAAMTLFDVLRRSF